MTFIYDKSELIFLYKKTSALDKKSMSPKQYLEGDPFKRNYTKLLTLSNDLIAKRETGFLI